MNPRIILKNFIQDLANYIVSNQEYLLSVPFIYHEGYNGYRTKINITPTVYLTNETIIELLQPYNLKGIIIDILIKEINLK